jgi:transcriptional regulator GlxA family with amidase domain
VEVLDLAGPLQALHEANRISHRYEIVLCASRERIRTEQGLELTALQPFPEPRAGDLVIVPGMPYTATEHLDRKTVTWVRRAHEAGAHIASVCTGAFVLGEAGLLDDRRCTTHWTRIDKLQRRFPRARVLDDRLFVVDGEITTSAGIASGIDMSLAIIERIDGPLVAAAVAREMVVYLRRDGAHGQQSVYLDYRTHLDPGVHRVQDAIVQKPAEKMTIAKLANVAAMSPRNLTRSFRRATGISIKEFATRVRLELARTLLNDPSMTIAAIAGRCGFSTPRQLRRAYRDAFGTTPGELRTNPPLRS